MNQLSRNKNESASKTTSALEASLTVANDKTGATSDMMAKVLAEMKGMRKDLTECLDKIEDSLKGVKEQIRGCENRLDEAEQRVSNTEDNGARADRLLVYMMRKQRCLEAHCEDIENRSRRSNLWICGVNEGTEGGENMLDFTARLLKVALKLPKDDNLGIERMHRLLATKPSNPNIYYQIYCGEISSLPDKATDPRRRREYGEIKCQLKERKIKFRSSYPAVLRVTLDHGERSFNSAWEAADQLKHLGITARLSEAEFMEKELHQWGWTVPLCPGGEQLTRTLVRDIESLSN
ncbi:hypothetical protein ABVT39_010955 [Epinephelus coioides]